MTPGEIPHKMPAVFFDGRLKLVNDYPVPTPPADWALIRTLTAGICRTDLEIIKGYMGFAGILGHEFVGEVHACAQTAWVGRRVTGEITVVGSRCGLFKEGLAMLQQHRDMPVERLITAKYPLDRALEAFNRAQAPGALKVLIEVAKPSTQTGRRAIVAS